MPHDLNRYFPPARTDRAGWTPPERPDLAAAALALRPAVSPLRPHVERDEAYPSLRDRAQGPAPYVGLKYERYETITFTLAAVSTIQDAGSFSGTPDAIDLRASAANVQVFLGDEVRRDESAIVLDGTTRYLSQIARRRIFAQDLTGAGTQVLTAIGKWAAPVKNDAE